MQYGHVPRETMTDAFAEEVVRLLTPGVAACVQAAKERKREEGSPAKRVKVQPGGDE